jgi:hypothetical protein
MMQYTVKAVSLPHKTSKRIKNTFNNLSLHKKADVSAMLMKYISHFCNRCSALYHVTVEVFKACAVWTIYFNVKNCTFEGSALCVFRLMLRTNTDYLPTQRQPAVLYDSYAMCLFYCKN